MHDAVVSKLIAASRGSPCDSMASCLNEGTVLTEVTDEGRAFQTVGAARLKAISAKIVLV